MPLYLLNGASETLRRMAKFYQCIYIRLENIFKSDSYDYEEKQVKTGFGFKLLEPSDF